MCVYVQRIEVARKHQLELMLSRVLKLHMQRAEKTRSHLTRDDDALSGRRKRLVSIDDEYTISSDRGHL